MKTKRLISLALFFVMVFTILPVTARAAEVASGNCGDNVTWVLDDEGTLIISGTGRMGDWLYPADGNYHPWYHLRSSIKKAVIEDGVTSIGDSSFYDCTNLTSVSIPDSITSIENSAFFDCSSLQTITIPDGVQRIGEWVFFSCGSLKDIYIPGSVTSIGEAAFEDCDGLKNVYYSGTQNQWNNIQKGYRNDYLVGATLHAGDSGFSAKKYGWSIINVGTSFGYEKGYQIPIWSYYGAGTSFKSVVNSIASRFDTWKGSCFGLSLLAIAEYNGQVDLSSFFSHSGTTLNEFGYEEIVTASYTSENTGKVFSGEIYSLAGNKQIIQAIERAQASQYSSEVVSTEVFKWDNNYSKLLSYLNENTPAPLLVTICLENGGHALAIDTSCKPIDCGNGQYAIMCYDCNSPQLTNPLNNGWAPYQYPQTYLLLDTTNGWYSYYYNGQQDGWYKYNELLVRQIRFYDISKLSPLFFAGITGELKLDLAEKRVTNCFNASDLTVEDRNNGMIFELSNGKPLLHSANAEYFPYCEDGFAGTGNHKGFVLLDEGEYIFSHTSTASVVRFSDDFAVVYEVDKAATVSFDDKNAVIIISNTSGSALQFDCVYEGANGNVVVSAEGVLDASGSIVIDVDCEGKTAVATTNSTAETINTILEVKGSVVDRDFHNKMDTLRLAGDTRFETAFEIADQFKENLGVSKFDAVIVASGTNFADALSGSYLAAVKNAPILLTCNKDFNPRLVETYNNMLVEYIKANMAPGGTVYILGGEKAVDPSLDAALAGYRVVRLAGATRYETNLEILKEAGVGNREVLICYGEKFPDSLAASATGNPILLVRNKLTDAQKSFLNTTSGKFVIIGGTAVISNDLENSLKNYGSTERLAGSNRYTTCVMVAERFFDQPSTAVVAYGENFPDGLCGGILAYSMDAPLILVREDYLKAATDYTTENTIRSGIVLGGDTLISYDAVRAIFAMDAADEILVK